MVCSNCGKEISADTKFCPDCGTAISEDSTNSTVNPNSSATENTSAGRKSKFKIVLVAIVVILIVRAVIISNLTNNHVGNSTNVENHKANNVHSRIDEFLDSMESCINKLEKVGELYLNGEISDRKFDLETQKLMKEQEKILKKVEDIDESDFSTEQAVRYLTLLQRLDEVDAY